METLLKKVQLKLSLIQSMKMRFHKLPKMKKLLRITEINVARYQDRAREAARVGDWASVAFFINEARVEAKDNQWLNSVIDNLEKYAKKDSKKILVKKLCIALIR